MSFGDFGHHLLEALYPRARRFRQVHLRQDAFAAALETAGESRAALACVQVSAIRHQRPDPQGDRRKHREQETIRQIDAT